MRIFIIRHGDPDYSIDNLTEKGKREVELLRHRMEKEGITKIYCSPLGRAQATAKPTADALGLEIVTCDWLREFVPRLPDFKCAPWNLPPRVWTEDKRVFDVSRWRDIDLWKNSDVIPYYDNVCSRTGSACRRCSPESSSSRHQSWRGKRSGLRNPGSDAGERTCPCNRSGRPGWP